MTHRSLTDRVLDGDPRAIARAISLIEDEAPAGSALIRGIFAHTGRAYVIGVTGPPGAGKSTLVDRLIAQLRSGGRTVGVVAIDPTSPFTGGAILGDRVRMQTHAADDGVFIRSMATRGHLGGLARATSDVALVLDASGKDVVIIETVGVGQDEIDIVRTADIAIVTMVPGAGDEVQALKAGVMEIADIFVVNKADREGADRTVASIEGLMALHPYTPGAWRPPVIKTEATTGMGVAAVLEATARFREHSAGTHGTRRRARAQWRVRELIAQRFVRYVEEDVLAPGELDRMVERIAARDLDPHSAVDVVLSRAVEHPSGNVIARAGGGVGGSRGALDHVGIAVADLDRALTFYGDVLGFERGAAEEVPSQGVRATFITLGEASLELLQATRDDSPIARFLAARGPGVHHVAIKVGNLEASLAHLKERGVRLVDEHPRPGAHGSQVAFIHPSSAHGVLVELVHVTTRGEGPSPGPKPDAAQSPKPKA